MSILTTCPELRQSRINLTDMVYDIIGNPWSECISSTYEFVAIRLEREKSEDMGFEVESVIDKNREAFEWLLGQLNQNAYPTWEELIKTDLHSHEESGLIQHVATTIVCRITNTFLKKIKDTETEKDILAEMKGKGIHYRKTNMDTEEYFEDEEGNTPLNNYIDGFLCEEWGIPDDDPEGFLKYVSAGLQN